MALNDLESARSGAEVASAVADTMASATRTMVGLLASVSDGRECEEVWLSMDDEGVPTLSLTSAESAERRGGLMWD